MRYRIGVMGFGGCPGEYPLGARDAEASCDVGRCENQRCSLVHFLVRIHEFGVGKGDGSIGGTGRADLKRRLRFAHPRVRVLRRRAAEARPQSGYAFDVGVDGFAAGATNCVFEDRVHLNRVHYAARRLGAMAHPQLDANRAIRPAWRFSPREIDACPARLCLGVAAFGAGQDHRLVCPALNLERRNAQQMVNGRPAPERYAGLGGGIADRFGDRPGGILVWPHAANHAHRAGVGQQRGRAGIAGGGARRPDHQVQGFLRRRRVVSALPDLRDAHQDRN